MRRKALALASGCIFLICMIGSTQLILKSWKILQHEPDIQHIPNASRAEDKVIVMAQTTGENVDWVAEELPDWQHAIYAMDNLSAPLHPPLNKGREAMAYLTYLIDHYGVLPEIIVFLHPHQQGWPQAWHTDSAGYSNVNSVRSLRLDYVREHGYANMRCLPNPGCPNEIQPFRNDTSRIFELAFANTYVLFFGGHYSTVPRAVGAACCSQFAVSRDRVRERPRADYARYRKWLVETVLSDYDSGRVMEYMWHIIFGKGPVWCPELTKCWCDQFGHC